MKRNVLKPLAWVASVAVALLFLAPLLWMVLASFRVESAIFETGVGQWFSGEGWTLEHYGDAWRRAALGQAFLNSLLQVAVICSVGLLINAMAAYAFARLDFKGREPLFAVVVILIILPVEVMVVPLFFTARDLGLTGAYLPAMGGLTIPFWRRRLTSIFCASIFSPYRRNWRKQPPSTARVPGGSSGTSRSLPSARRLPPSSCSICWSIGAISSGRS